MAFTTLVQATQVSSRCKAENRSSNFLGENLYTILLDVLPIVEDKILFNIDWMRGRTFSQ